MKKTVMYFLLGSLVLMFVNGCRHKQEEHSGDTSNPQSIKEALGHQQDILKKIHALIPQQTQRIDFRQDANAAKHILRGWGAIGEKGTWTSKKSSLMFFRYDTEHDVHLELACYAIPSQTNEPQNAEIFLNTQKIGTVVVPKDNEKPVELTLPAASLVPGVNILQFKFRYANRPNWTKKKLSAAFQSIEFKNNTIIQALDEQNLIQQADSTFSLLLELPKTFDLEVFYQNSEKTRSTIELRDDNQDVVMSLELPPAKQSVRHTVILKDRGVYALNLQSQGTSSGSTIWSGIHVYTEKQEEEVPGLENGFSKMEKPDILLYVIDTVRADHLGCYGYERETSPHLDAFAEENAFFENAYANASWTKASGASIMTGLFPKHHKTMMRDDVLPEDLLTLAEMLQQQGYHTVGLSANQVIGPDFGFEQGFDTFFNMFTRVDPLTKTCRADTLNEQLLDFLHTFRQQQDRPPLFMMMWVMDPHDPYAPPEEVGTMFDIKQYTPIDTYDPKLIRKIRSAKVPLPDASQIEYMRTRYDQEIYFVDQAFGSLLTTLHDLNMYDDTTIIVTSDHGEEFFDHGDLEHSWTLYNEVVKIPLVVKTPAIAPGTYPERVQIMDIYPTILDLLGLDTPSYQLDGISLVPPLSPERILYFEQATGGCDLTATLNSDKKLIFNTLDTRQKLIPRFRPPLIELYAANDPQELTRLELSTRHDEMLSLQQLFSFRNDESKQSIHRTQIELSPELDRQLKDLGYIK